MAQGLLESLGKTHWDILKGSYTDKGIEKWLFRSRTQLGGQSPAQCIAAPCGDQLQKLKILIEGALLQ